MLVELFIFFEIVALVFFILAFYSNQELLWVISLVLFGVLAYTSYDVSSYNYVYNETITAYQPQVVSNSYPYLMGINILFFVLALIMGLYDLFTKYSTPFGKKV